MGFLAQGGHILHYLSDLLDSGDVDGMILSARHGAPRGTGAFRQRGGQVLVDPETFRLAEPVDATRRFRAHSYVQGWTGLDRLQRPGELRLFTERVVQEELEAGATEIIAPYFYVDDVRGDKLETSLRAAEAALEHAPSVGNPRVWAGILINGGEIKREASRNLLLDKITGSGISRCYLVVDPEGGSGAPVSDRDLVMGIRYVVRWLEGPQNDVRVLLGYSDPLGLGLMNDGLTSFASGVYNSQRKLMISELRRRRRSGGGGRPAAKRYYIPSLMNFVRADRELQVMGQRGAFAGQQPCVCGYCRRNFVTGGSYSEALGWQHYLSTLTRQSTAMAALRPEDRLVEFQRELAAARGTYESLERAGIRFDSESGSAHITAWQKCFR